RTKTSSRRNSLEEKGKTIVKCSDVEIRFTLENVALVRCRSKRGSVYRHSPNRSDSTGRRRRRLKYVANKRHDAIAQTVHDTFIPKRLLHPTPPSLPSLRYPIHRH